MRLFGFAAHAGMDGVEFGVAELVEVIRAAEWLSVPGVLLVAWWLIATGRLVTRREHDDLRDDRDWWRDAATEALHLGEEAVDEAVNDGP